MTIRQQITDGVAALWGLSKGLILTCAAALVLAVIGYTGVKLWANGWLDQVIPEPAIVKAEPPEPLTVVMHGSAKGITGCSYVFTAEITGQAGRAVWDVTPLTEGASAEGTLRTFDLGRWAEFTSVDEGDFLISVTVGGEANQAAAAKIKFENLRLATMDELEPPPTDEHEMPAEEPTAGAPPPAPVLPSVEEMIRGALEAVGSPNKASEARQLGGSVRLFAQRLNTGLLPPDTDVPLEMEKHAKALLGDKFDNWQMFLVAIDNVIGDLRDRGQITTAASTVPVLYKIADVLQNAK